MKFVGIGPSDVVVSGATFTITGAPATVAAGPWAATGGNTALVSVTWGTAGSLQFQGSVDGSTWIKLNFWQEVDNTLSETSTTSISATGVYRVPIGGYQQFRLVVLTTGSVNGTVSIALSTSFWGPVPTQNVSIATALPTGANTIGNVGLVAGSAKVGQVAIDQTTPGTTNLVQVGGSLPAGTNVIGHVINDANASVIIGKVGIDQTTPGTTNGVQIIAAIPAGANTIGNVGLIAGAAKVGIFTTDQTTHGTTDLVAADNTKWGGATLGAAAAIGTSATGNVLAVQGVTGGVAQPVAVIPKAITVTTALLGSAGVFTQTGVDTNLDGNTEVHVSALSSIGGSAVNGFIVQTSDDNVNWTTIGQTTVTANVISLLTVSVYQRYWRIKYTNGATAQTGTFNITAQVDLGFIPVTRPYTGYSGVAVPVVSINDATNTSAYSAAATTVIKAFPGRLVSILVTTAGTAACNIYDNASAASGTIIGVVPANTVAGTVLVFAAPAVNGITVGGVAANCAFTVMYA